MFRNTPMFMMLEKETEIEDFEDSVAHDRSKLRDFGIDNDSEIDETNKCEKPSTSFTEQEKVDNRNVFFFFLYISEVLYIYCFIYFYITHLLYISYFYIVIYNLSYFLLQKTNIYLILFCVFYP